jgi:hypothetical protein
MNFRIAQAFVAAVVFAASLSACAPAESYTSTAQGERTLSQLQAARELDLSNATDPGVGPIASGYYSVQADKADQVMYELEHSQDVCQAQIRDALFVPPKAVSPAERAQLVHELKDARSLDRTGWWDWTRDPVIAQDFSVQEEKANRAIRDLETQQEVSWSEIHEGLSVPRYP